MVPHDVILQFAPDVYFHKNERYFPCSIEYLLSNSTLKDRNTPGWSVDNPTQESLFQYCQKNYYVVINPSQFTGMGVTAPMYYAVREYTDIIEISYIMLYAYQGGQTCAATPPIGDNFDCIISTLGTHQGDLERIIVRIKPYHSEYNVVQVGFEAHGEPTWYLQKDVAWNGTHPIVNVALCGHSCHNMYMTGDRVVEYHIPLVMDIFSALGNDGQVWRPYTTNNLIQLGLTKKDGAPINDQLWSKFAGKLGDSLINSLESGYYLDWTNLSASAWAYVKLVNIVGNALHVISDTLIHGDGPDGPAMRCNDWDCPASGSLFNDQFFVVWQNADMKEGPGNVGWLTGNYLGTKYDQTIQLWDNGSLGMIMYGSDGNGGIKELWSTDNTGQGPKALQWFSGKFYGDNVDRIIQLCNISGNLGIILYEATPQNTIQVRWSTSNAGHFGPWMNTGNYLAGNFFGDGKDRIVQCLGEGQLVMTMYGANASGEIVQTWSSNGNIQQGPGALQWMVGNFTDSTKQQILQLCDIGACLGFIMYGSDGNGGLKQLWANTTAEGVGNVAFVKGDFNGDAREEVIQLWDNGTLGMIMYGFDANGVSILWSTGNINDEGPRAFQWLVGDFQGDGKDEILQLWSPDGSSLGMIMYGSDGAGGMKVLWSTSGIGPGTPFATMAQYLVGNFMGDGVQEVLQWYGIGELRGAAYATFS